MEKAIPPDEALVRDQLFIPFIPCRHYQELIVVIYSSLEVMRFLKMSKKFIFEKLQADMRVFCLRTSSFGRFPSSPFPTGRAVDC